jgi:signal transduction histidine kinase
MNLDRKVMDIPALMHGVLDVYRYVAEEKDLQVRINAPCELYVTADQNRMSQVLGNLLD